MSDFTNIVVGGIYDGVFNTCYEQMDYLLDSRVQYNCGDQVCYAVFTTDGLDSNFCSCLLDNTENRAIIFQGSSNYAICGCIDGHPILGNVDRYSQLGACTVSTTSGITESTPSLSTVSPSSSVTSSATSTHSGTSTGTGGSVLSSLPSVTTGGSITGSSSSSASRASSVTGNGSTVSVSSSTATVSSSTAPVSPSTITDSTNPAGSASSSSTISVSVTPAPSISNSGTTSSGSTASVTSSKGNAAAALKPTSFNWKSEGMLYVASILLSTLALSMLE